VLLIGSEAAWSLPWWHREICCSSAASGQRLQEAREEKSWTKKCWQCCRTGR